MQYNLINKQLQIQPPKRLFHYTSPAGLIGIVQSKKVWATHVKYLNDNKELYLAVDIARSIISSRIRELGDLSVEDEKITLLNNMSSYSGGASSDVYVCSLTEERDILSQWRAYCPPGGGYSIGFSSDQLKSMAKKQGFFLSRCVYDHNIQQKLIRDIFEFHYKKAVEAIEQTPKGERGESFVRDLAVTFARELAKYGPIVKHASFKEEKEWRLVAYSRGVNHPSIMHRAGPHSIIPYLEFDLASDTFPDLSRRGCDDNLTVIAGPTRDMSASSFAMQSLMHKYFPAIPSAFSMGQSQSPYRGT